MDKLCEYCNQTIITARSNQKYHIECAAPALRERRQKFYYNGERIRPPLYCARCGVHIEVPIGTQRLCPACILREKSENIKKANLRNEEKLGLEPEKKKKKKTFLSLAEVDRLARAEGLSYGQYSVKYGLYSSVYHAGRLQ